MPYLEEHLTRLPEEYTLRSMGKIALEGLQCERCGHIWLPMKPVSEIRICPKCKSPYWDRPRRNKPKEKEGK